jgi:hypothetical protein
MPLNKISGQSALPPMLPIGLAAGETFLLPVGQGIVGAFGTVLQPQIATNNPLTGQFCLQLGQYSTLQQFDTGLNYWNDVNVAPMSLTTISSDGSNYRVANSTGCPVGALITTATLGVANGFYGFGQLGDAFTGAITIQNGITTAGNTVFTITPSAGGSQWNSIVGGAINTTISFTGTIFNGNLSSQNNGAGQSLNAFGQTSAAGGITASAGANYTRPPIIVFTPPVNQGQQPYILPTAVCAITAGAISSVTVTNQGAGLMSLPGIVVVPQPGDFTGGGAVLGWLFGATGTAGLGAGTGSGTLLAMWPAYYGTPQTAAPTFTFSPTGPAVTPVMNFTVTGFTQTTAGVAYVGAGGAFSGGYVAGTAANTNPMYDRGLSIPLYPTGFTVAATTGLPSLLAGAFAGVNIQAVPTFSAFSSGAAPTTAAVTTVTVGGQNDVIKLISF